MTNVKFMDLNIGDKFTFNGIEYEKIPEERISCCHANNAKQLNDTNVKIQVIPIQEVVVND